MSMVRPALVSIIIPTYKTAWFEQTLSSAVAQDYPNCEIIVSDDSPCGEPKDIVEAWRSRSRHPLIYFRNKPALGDVGNYEKCFRESKGKYIKLFSDDDLLTPDCVTLLVKAIEVDSNIRIATSKRLRIDIENNPQQDIYATASPVNEDSIIHGTDLFFFQEKHSVNFIGEPCTVLVYRDDIIELMQTPDGLFKLDGKLVSYLEDLTMYTKILRKGHLAYLTKPLSSFRISRSQKSEMAKLDKEGVIKSYSSYQKFVAAYIGEQESGTKSELVRVAPLHSPTNFMFCDIHDSMVNDLKQSHFGYWMGLRTLLPIQEKIIKEYITLNKLSTRLSVVINGIDASEESISATLNSLCYLAPPPGLNIDVKVIGESELVEVNTVLAFTENKITIFNELIAGSNSDWMIFVNAGTEFHRSGLLALATTLTQAGGLLAIYCDESYTLNGKRMGVKFRPDFNLDFLLSSPSNMAHRWIWRCDLLQTLGGFNTDFSDAYELELSLRIIETQGFNSLGHLPEPLTHLPVTEENGSDDNKVILRHLANRGYPDAHIDIAEYGNFRLHYNHSETPLVSLIVVGTAQISSMMSCVMTIIEKTSWLNYELILVINGVQSDEANNWLSSVVEVDPSRIRVERYAGEWHYAKMANQGVNVALGEYICLLNAGVSIIENQWLGSLLNHGMRPEVGIVGGKQIYADGTVHHAGYVLGINGIAGNAFYAMSDENKGYMHRLHADQNYSAVSGDFMLIRKSVYQVVNGMDETLYNFSDVDFCLRVRERGYLTVWTPYSRVLRSTNLKNTKTNENYNKHILSDTHEEDELYKKWMPMIANDPAFNVNLTLDGEQFSVCPDSLLSWHPLDWKPLPVVLPHIVDLADCGFHRIIKPFEAMRDEGIIDGKLSETLLSVPYMERYQPDSIIFQSQFTPEFYKWIFKLKKYSNAFKVFDMENYLLNFLFKNHYKMGFGKDKLKMLRENVSFMDRCIVSTEPFAEALQKIHSDIVVRQNCLPLDWWGNLTSLKGQGGKPRVGWNGRASHNGDLEVIYDVIKIMAKDVDWVFLGMCPPKLQPYIKELHLDVNNDIALYPQKLASLNLDLALAPAENNQFNMFNSNIKLLEYGACAIPVICSDVPCYQGNFPVTRVKNRFKDWHDAICMHLSDRQASLRMGKELKILINEHYMLDANIAKEWAGAWLSS